MNRNAYPLWLKELNTIWVRKKKKEKKKECGSCFSHTSSHTCTAHAPRTHLATHTSSRNPIQQHPIQFNPMSFEFNNLQFDGTKGRYRLQYKRSPTPKVKSSLWMENRTSKQQWNMELSDDFAKYGPVGVPSEAVLEFLQQALSKCESCPDEQWDCTNANIKAESLQRTSNQIARSEGEETAYPRINVNCSAAEDGGLVLVLSLSFSKAWTYLWIGLTSWQRG